MSSSESDRTRKMFAGFDNSTIRFLIAFEHLIDPISDVLQMNEYKVGVVSVGLNLVHFLILCEKSMRTTSTNIIMAGMAVSDMLYPLAPIRAQFFPLVSGPCAPLPGYWAVWLTWQLRSSSDFFRRTSSWLGIFLAAFRVFLVKFPFLPSATLVSSPKAGLFAILIVSMISFPLAVFFDFNSIITSQIIERTSKQCPGNPDNYTVTYFYTLENPVFRENGAFLRRLNFLIDGVVSKIIPSISFLILSVLLIRIAVGSRKKQRNTLRSSKRTGFDKTTKIIALMTFLFLLCEFPIGLIYTAESLTSSNGVYAIVISCYGVANFMYTAFSATHFVTNFILSTPYRNAFRSLIFRGKMWRPHSKTYPKSSFAVTIMTTTAT